jgi:hypothetical protein
MSKMGKMEGNPVLTATASRTGWEVTATSLLRNVPAIMCAADALWTPCKRTTLLALNPQPNILVYQTVKTASRFDDIRKYFCDPEDSSEKTDESCTSDDRSTFESTSENLRT